MMMRHWYVHTLMDRPILSLDSDSIVLSTTTYTSHYLPSHKVGIYFFPDKVFSLSFTAKLVQFFSPSVARDKNWTHLPVKLSENTSSGKKKKVKGGGAPKGRFWGFIRSWLSLCFGKKWGDCQISAKVTFSCAKQPKIPKFPILLARWKRLSESSVVLKSQLNRAKIVDFLLLAKFRPLPLFFSFNLYLPLLCLCFHSCIQTIGQT